MPSHIYIVVLFILFGVLYRESSGIFMQKLAKKKLCADDKCIYVLSLAKAEDDYNAPDCRFINIKKGELIYVYSKLVKDKAGGEFWSGSVYSDQYRDQMGLIGYFPRTLAAELRVYQNVTIELPTKAIDFYCE
ncbi:otoraplin [Bombina bombina]|uniref:otoraplin n=1 Tax=Bombina bombina TaxID=8345 RepID=UPI00235AABCB|nr:otoraplin [Bombina bombina]